MDELDDLFMIEIDNGINEHNDQEREPIIVEAHLTESFKLKSAGIKIQKLENKLKEANDRIGQFAIASESQRKLIAELQNKVTVLEKNNKQLKGKMNSLKSILS